MERVKKGEEYWFIDKDGEILWRYESYSCQDDMMFGYNNYFHTKEEAEAMVNKIRAVLKGADVIEMPSDTGVYNRSLLADIPINADANDAYRKGAMDMANWLKSKIVK